MQAIETRTLPATDTLPTRYKAIASAGTVIVSGAHIMGHEDGHKRAALALCARYDWSGRMVSGGLRNGSTVWVFVEGSPEINPAGKVCPVCRDAHCETKSELCGK